MNYSELIELFDNAKSKNEIKEKVMPKYPEKCLITGYRKCESYYFGEGIVYLPEPAYDAYTLPEYVRQWKEFCSVKIDMDDEFSREYITLCNLIDVVEWKRFSEISEIKEFYEIPEEDIEWAKKELEEITLEEE